MVMKDTDYIKWNSNIKYINHCAYIPDIYLYNKGLSKHQTTFGKGVIVYSWLKIQNFQHVIFLRQSEAMYLTFFKNFSSKFNFRLIMIQKQQIFPELHVLVLYSKTRQ